MLHRDLVSVLYFLILLFSGLETHQLVIVAQTTVGLQSEKSGVQSSLLLVMLSGLFTTPPLATVSNRTRLPQMLVEAELPTLPLISPVSRSKTREHRGAAVAPEMRIPILIRRKLSGSSSLVRNESEE